MRRVLELPASEALGWRRRLRGILSREMVADLVVAGGGLVVAATGAAAAWANLVWRLGQEERLPLALAAAAIGGVLFVALRVYARARARPLSDARAHLLADLGVLLGLFALFVAAAYVTRSADAFARGWMLSWLLLASGGLFALRVAVAKAVMPRLRDLLARRVVVAGLPGQVAALRRSLADAAVPEDLYIAVAVSGDDAEEVARRVLDLCAREPVDEVVLAVPVSDGEAVARLCGALVAVPADVSLWLGEGAARLARLGLFELDPLPRQLLLRRPIRDWGRIAKGLMDRVGAVVLLVLLSPLFLLIALAIRLDSPGPVFYRQLRRGLGGRPFEMLKFRSMYADRCDAPDAPICQATRDDPRVTRVGRWLRRTSLDELPQLWNVLRGEMSLVGPRPHPVRMDEEYRGIVERYMARYRLKPGITGWAQVHGYRGETRDIEAMRARIAYDVDYARSWSLALDLWILFLTPWIVLSRRNAY